MSDLSNLSNWSKNSTGKKRHGVVLTLQKASWRLEQQGSCHELDGGDLGGGLDLVVNLVVMVMIMIMISIIMILVARGRIAVWDTGGGDGSWLGDLLVGEGVVDKVMLDDDDDDGDLLVGEGVVDKVVIIIIVIITKLMMMIQTNVQVHLGLAEGKATSGSVERIGPGEVRCTQYYTVIMIIVIVVIFENRSEKSKFS